MNWKADADQVVASRIATTQPSYDFLAGGSASLPQNALRQTFRQSQAPKPGSWVFNVKIEL